MSQMLIVSLPYQGELFIEYEQYGPLPSMAAVALLSARGYDPTTLTDDLMVLTEDRKGAPVRDVAEQGLDHRRGQVCRHEQRPQGEQDGPDFVRS